MSIHIVAGHPTTFSCLPRLQSPVADCLSDIIMIHRFKNMGNIQVLKSVYVWYTNKLGNRSSKIIV